MAFSTDRQTLEDLKIFDRAGDSLFQLFNRCATRGGAAVLEDMFSHPLCDHIAINRRSGIIRFFSENPMEFPVRSIHFDAIDPYLSNVDERTRLSAQEHSISKKISSMIAADTETVMIHKGITAVTVLLKETAAFIASPVITGAELYRSDREGMEAMLAIPALAAVCRHQGKLSQAQLVEYDVVFRFRYREEIRKLLRYLYVLDVYLSVARVARERAFVFPVALPAGASEIKIEGVYHPAIKNAVPNAVHITAKNNVIFLTGANMAGKSTFMKTLSIALFLAHTGFPVAATAMRFHVLDGIYTTINLPDNLGMGASHFYAEVLRLKKVAHELSQGKKIFVVFDELFRGTNVKDAYEATIAVTSAFAEKRDSIFVISTHIIEAGPVLKARCRNIGFLYLPTRMKGAVPEYTYQLEEGITDDRHGMVIINNEKILETLEAGVQQAQKTTTPHPAAFIADKQTTDDLNLLGKYKPHSIYSLFSKVKTKGGEWLLDAMFQHPLTDPDSINRRCSIFRYFQERKWVFPLDGIVFGVAEEYLGGGTSSGLLQAAISVMRKKMMAIFLRDERYGALCKGLQATIGVLKKMTAFSKGLNVPPDSPYYDQAEKLRKILSDHRLNWMLHHQETELSMLTVTRLDYLLRHTLRHEMESLLACIYEIDVYISVSNVARERGLSYASAIPATGSVLKAAALWHPALEKPVANPIALHNDSNLLFLTGANMAGKSTFMKSLGIAVYLAHMGFPVAARNMQFSVRDGLYSSINVADNLNLGYSHFYAEVLRVKNAAEQVSQGRNMVVIFDELFKGTNVKDAYDATLSVTAAFSKYRNCVFVISTHIIEVGEVLQSFPNLQFEYMPTIMEGNVPKYPYTLRKGITSDRHGMMIVQNEGILEMIRGVSKGIYQPNTFAS